MDETGHSGDTGAAERGDGADSRERTGVNGWASSDSPWSYTGPGPETDGEAPAWRRSGAETRSFPRNPAFPSSALPVSAQPSSGIPAPVPAPTPPGFVDAETTGENPPSEDSRWSSLPSYADRPAPQGPRSGEPATSREPGLTTGGVRGPGPVAGTGRDADTAREQSFEAPREPGSGTGGGAAGMTSGAGRPTSLRGFDVPAPNSAPPYPYEGDLDDATPELPPRPVVQQRTPVPMVRPATPGGRRAGWGTTGQTSEAARHALTGGTPLQGLPRVVSAEESGPVRPSYDPSSFPRRLSYEPPAPYEPSPVYEPESQKPYESHKPYESQKPYGEQPYEAQRPYEVPKPYEAPAPYAGSGARGTTAGLGAPSDMTTRVLPQRVPAQPDVPGVPEPPLVEPTAETPALARIATHLRRGDVRPVQERQEGFDVRAILAAVRGVDGVRDASLRSTPAGAHSLRLDLAEGADPAEVSRRVARLLQDRMGLDAAMQGEAPPAAAPAAEAPARPAAEAPARPAAETRPAGSGPVQTRPAENRAGAYRSAEARPAEVRPAQARPAETPAPTFRPAAEVRNTAETRAAETRAAETRAAETRAAETSAAPFRPAAEARSDVAARPVEARRAETPAPPFRPAAETPPVETRSAGSHSADGRPAEAGSTGASFAGARSTEARAAGARSTETPPAEARPAGTRPAEDRPAEARPAAAVSAEARPAAAGSAEARPATQSLPTAEAPDRPAAARPSAEPLERPSRDPSTLLPTARPPQPVEQVPAPPTPVPAPPTSAPPIAAALAEARTEEAARPPAAERRPPVAARPAPARPSHERSAWSSETAESGEVVPSGADCGPPRPLHPGEHPGPRIVIENVHVNTFGSDATVEVKLAVGDRTASGVASGPAVDGYLLRLCAMATAGAVDELLAASDHPDGPARCFVEHAAAVPFGAAHVAVVVMLLSCGGWVEQLAGSAVVTSDDRHAMVRATLAAVNRRLEALLSR